MTYYPTAPGVTVNILPGTGGVGGGDSVAPLVPVGPSSRGQLTLVGMSGGVAGATVDGTLLSVDGSGPYLDSMSGTYGITVDGTGPYLDLTSTHGVLFDTSYYTNAA